MTPAYLKKRIAETQPDIVELYERNVPFSDFHITIPALAIKKGDDVDAILDHFFSNYTGTFTALIRRGAKDHRKNGERIVLMNSNAPGDAEMMPQPVNGAPQYKNEEQLRREILADVRREMELENLRNEVLELQRQHTIQNGLENRLTTVLEKLFFSSKLAQATTPAATPIQGTPTINNAENMHDINELTEAQTEQLEEVVAEIYQHLGLNTLVKVRDALRRDPGLAKKLELFI